MAYEGGHTVPVGDLTVTVFSDGHFDIPGEFFTAPEGGGVTDEPERIAANVWLVDAKGRRLLIDAGSGQALAGRFTTVGGLHDILAAAGVDRASIDDIIITHMHADHIGGLHGEDGLAFPNATLHVPRAEWAFWTAEETLEGAPEEARPMIEAIQMLAAPFKDTVILHDDGDSLGHGLTLVAAPGHTPGHSMVRIASGNDSLLVGGDVIVSGDLQFARPGITYALDGDPGQAARTRRETLTELSQSGERFAATHLAFPGIGTVAQDGGGFAFTPVAPGD
ncbi:MAG: MBL fold metallo-hydrolase [Pseudomonadota bacterium]